MGIFGIGGSNDPREQPGGSLAQQQLNRGMRRSMSNAYAQAQSQRGVNPALANRNAMMTAQNASADANAQGSLVRAQEQTDILRRKDENTRATGNTIGAGIGAIGSTLATIYGTPLAGAAVGAGAGLATEALFGKDGITAQNATDAGVRVGSALAQQQAGGVAGSATDASRDLAAKTSWQAANEAQIAARGVSAGQMNQDVAGKAARFTQSGAASAPVVAQAGKKFAQPAAQPTVAQTAAAQPTVASQYYGNTPPNPIQGPGVSVPAAQPATSEFGAPVSSGVPLNTAEQRFINGEPPPTTAAPLSFQDAAGRMVATSNPTARQMRLEAQRQALMGRVTRAVDENIGAYQPMGGQSMTRNGY